MAVENRGGFRPTAPQNNPTNINPMGGNGQSGMNTDYSGFAYGMNKAINEQRKAAPLAGSANMPVNVATRTAPAAMSDIVPLDAPTQRPEEPVTVGSALGEGPGEEILGLAPMTPVQTADSGAAAVRALYLLDPNNQDLRRMLDYIDNGGAVS